MNSPILEKTTVLVVKYKSGPIFHKTGTKGKCSICDEYKDLAYSFVLESGTLLTSQCIDCFDRDNHINPYDL